MRAALLVLSALGMVFLVCAVFFLGVWLKWWRVPWLGIELREAGLLMLAFTVATWACLAGSSDL